jgi:hypothetical protein
MTGALDWPFYFSSEDATESMDGTWESNLSSSNAPMLSSVSESLPALEQGLSHTDVGEPERLEGTGSYRASPSSPNLIQRKNLTV